MRLILPVLLSSALLCAAFPALAAQHLMSIREVYVGPASDPSAQYVMLQMYSADQNQVAGHSVRIYNATDTIVGSFTFGTNVANGQNQAFILIATPEAATRFNITPDLSMNTTTRLTPAGGKVCFETFDCFSWGNYSGDRTNPAVSGTPFEAAAGLAADRAARRDISAGNSTQLESTDDTGDSAADFDSVANPIPRNNAGSTGTAPGSGDDGDGGYGGNTGGSGGGSGYGGGGALSLLSVLILLLGWAHRR